MYEPGLEPLNALTTSCRKTELMTLFVFTSVYQAAERKRDPIFQTGLL
jgi:hypothetical protein